MELDEKLKKNLQKVLQLMQHLTVIHSNDLICGESHGAQILLHRILDVLLTGMFVCVCQSP